MKNRRWVLIRSWHALSMPESLARTLCGRSGVWTEASDTLPAGKSCETCLRIVARQDDAP